MINPFEIMNELIAMNEQLSQRLDTIINRLDTLIELERNDLYGDGK